MCFTEEFSDWRFDTAIFLNLHPSQTFGTIDTNEFNQTVQLTARDRGIAFNIDSFNDTAVFYDSIEHFKVRILNIFRHIDQFHTKTQVRLIAAKTIHSFVPGQTLHRQLDLFTHSAFKYIRHQAFHHFHNILSVYERHFNIQLSKFRLTVSTQIFIAEAAGDLEITLHTGNHQDLFKNLR